MPAGLPLILALPAAFFVGPSPRALHRLSFMNLHIINPVDHPDWDSLLPTSGQASFFHTAGWARVLSQTYGYKARYFTITDNGLIVGLMPVMEIKSLLTGKRGVSLPFTDACVPLAEDRETFALLLKESVAFGRQAGWKHLEFRGAKSWMPPGPASSMHLVHALELSADEMEVSARFKPNVRRNIRKSKKEGVKVRLMHSLGAMAAYYRLHCGTRRYHGLPPQPWLFFKKMHEHIIGPGKGFIALAEFQNRWIAGAVFLQHRDQAIYKYGASDIRFQRLRPNNLVMWEALRWCCRNNVRRFSFGRTDPKNEGLRHYKNGWGAVEDRLLYHRLDLRSSCFVGTHGTPKSSSAVFKSLPLPMLRLAGRLLYRHVG